MYLDIKKLKEDLIKLKEEEYYLGGFKTSLIEITEIESASDESLIEIAMNNNFNISNYLVKIKRK